MQMKVLLTDDVKKLGWLGDVVEVAEGYARNYLFPQGLAKPATETNIKAIAKTKASRAEERRLEREQLEKTAQAVNGAEAVIGALANEQGHLFGSVFKHEIAENLRSQGFAVSDDVVALDEHIKQVGTYSISLRFADDLKATVNVVVVPEGVDAETFKQAQQEAASTGSPDNDIRGRAGQAAKKPAHAPAGEATQGAATPEAKEEKPQQ
jgi:large subunit ribosomal protein L9